MKPLLVIACGALAADLKAIVTLNAAPRICIRCLPAHLHNRPEHIAGRVRAALEQARGEDWAQIFIAYADCGTGGELDRVLSEYKVERLPGAHCYAAFAGEERFNQISKAEPGTFYLTDFLVRHFDRLVIQELGIARHPELATTYFGHYRRVFYLAQQPDSELLSQARTVADRLDLDFEWELTGYGALQTSLIALQEAH